MEVDMEDLLSTISIDGIVKAVYSGDMMTVEFRGGVIGVKILYANVNGRYANVGEKVYVYGKLQEFGNTFIVEALTVAPWYDVEVPKSNDQDQADFRQKWGIHDHAGWGIRNKSNELDDGEVV
jgi:hypothetical protein